MKWFHVSYLIVSIFLLKGCGPDNHPDSSDLKILRGSLISDSQQDARRRSTVAITTDSVKDPSKSSPLLANRSFCSGTVIGPRTIVTAAHCLQVFEAKTRSKGSLLFGEDKFLVSFDTTVSPSGTWIRAKRVIPHPEWNPKAMLSPTNTAAPHDIGLIILSEDIPAKAKPVAIADERLELKKKSAVFLAGYGVTKKRSLPDTGTLRQVEVKLSSVDKDRKMFSVGKFMKGACAGDSGGPAYVQVASGLQLMGATSTGIEILGYCVGIRNNYTDVRQYKSWITETVAKIEAEEAANDKATEVEEEKAEEEHEDIDVEGYFY